MTAATAAQHARYLSEPRECIDCGEPPSAGRPRCETCHEHRHDELIEGHQR